MSMTESESRSTSRNGRVSTADRYSERVVRETKPSFMTTEFWALLVGVVAVAVIYNASRDASLDLFRASLLATMLAVGYMVSRGLAKAGSRDVRTDDHNR
jgi:hypothetical protein